MRKETNGGRLWLSPQSLCLVVAAIALSGCAAIIKGTKHSVDVSSTPASAQITINRVSNGGGGLEIFSGTTPATVELSKKNEYVVMIALDGHKEMKVPVTHTGIEGWFWANILCSAPAGLLVDYVTGAMNKMEPSTINVTLESASLPGQPANQLYATFRALDAQGNLRSMAIPMIPLN